MPPEHTAFDVVNMLAQSLSAVFAAASVLFAIYVFRRDRDKSMFSAFRLALVDIKATIRRIDNLLSEPYFTDIGHRIGQRVIALLPADATSQDLTAYLTDSAKHDLVGQAIHLGRLDAPSLGKLEDLRADLERIPFGYRDLFPAAFAIIRSLSAYVHQIATNCSSPRLFESILAKPESVTNILAPALSQVSCASDSRVMFEVFISAAPISVIKKHQPVYDLAEALIVMLVEKYSQMNDAQLRQQSHRERRLQKQLDRINLRTHVEDAFAYFNLIRTLFTQDQWDRIVELKTKLMSQAHENNK